MIAVSAIIPAYNAAGTIRACIESVKRQSVPGIEIIVVDDGSADATASIAGAIPGVRLIEQANAGPASARNRGIEAAGGEWLAFLDSDEEWPGADEIGAQLACARARGAVLVGASGRPGVEKVIGMGRLLLGNPFATSSVLAARRTVQECGGFDPGRYYSEDYLLWLRIVARGGAAVLAGVAGSRNLSGRRAFDGGGLSGDLVRMQRGELENFRTLRREGLLGDGAVRPALAHAAAAAFSELKFLRRIAIRAARRLRGRR